MSTRDPYIGKTIDKYRLDLLLGQGGMGMVYKAEDLSLHRSVAVKLLPLQQGVGAVALQRFVREARTSARLIHPNIVTVHDVGSNDSAYFIVMEFVDGETLEEMVAREGKVGVRAALTILLQITDALTHAHEEGIVHRDIKPSNIMVTSKGLAKVMDFGLALSLADTTELTAADRTMGTPRYMSPEQCRGLELDERSDVFSLGATFLEVMSGVKPYDGESQVALMQQIVNGPIPRLNELNPEASERLTDIISKMMARDPRERYASVAEVQRAIESYMGIQGPTSGFAAFGEEDFLPPDSGAFLNELSRGDKEIKRGRPSSTPAQGHVDVSGSNASAPAAGVRDRGEAIEYVEQGERYYKDRFYKKAEDSFRSAIRADDSYARAHYCLGRTFRKFKRSEDALASFQRVIELDPMSELALDAKKFVDRIEEHYGVEISDASVRTVPVVESVDVAGSRSWMKNLLIAVPIVAIVAAVVTPILYFVLSDDGTKFSPMFPAENFVWIEPGAFMMGSPDTEVGRDDVDETYHHVTLTSGFWMSKFEVTQGQWEAVMGTNPSYFEGSEKPVEQVSRDEVNEFIETLNAKYRTAYRLPTEAEWEYACRAGSEAAYSFGNDEGLLRDYGVYAANNAGGPSPVGSKKPNAWGLFDMHGNVWEYCSDWSGPYPRVAVIDPSGPTYGTMRIGRGGSWRNPGVNSRAADRSASPADAKGSEVGFRLAL